MSNTTSSITFQKTFRDEQSKTIAEHGAFFAFSKIQYDSKRKPDVKYTTIATGLVCPDTQIESLDKALTDLIDKFIQQDLAENTLKEIIWRELGNHEVQFSGDLTAVEEALSDHKITPAQIKDEYDEYYQMCIDEDMF